MAGAPSTDTSPDLTTRDALATNQAQFLTRYTAALAQRAARVVNYGDSMSSASVAWRTWPFLAEAAMARVVGSADTDMTTPSSSSAWRLWNRSINASDMTDHIDAGLAADIATIDPHLVIISCGVATWLADKTGATYQSSLEAGVAAIRAATDEADILIIHEYEPELDLAAPNTFAGWGDTTKPIASEVAARLGCAFVSLYKPFGSVAGDGDPRGLFTLPSPAITDMIHTNGDGAELIWSIIAPVLTQQRRSAEAPLPVDLGQSRSTSTSELSVLATPMSIPANTLQPNDELLARIMVSVVNLSGGAATVRLRLKVGGTTYLDSGNLAIANGTGLLLNSTIAMLVEGISPSPIIHVDPALTYGPGLNAAATGTLLNTTGASTLAAATTSAIALDATIQMSVSSAALITECRWATLTRPQRFRP